MKAEVRNPSGALTDCLVTDEANGTYSVEYTPFETGNTPAAVFSLPPNITEDEAVISSCLTDWCTFQASTVSTFCMTTRQFPRALSGFLWQKDVTPAGWWLLALGSKKL